MKGLDRDACAQLVAEILEKSERLILEHEVTAEQPVYNEVREAYNRGYQDGLSAAYDRSWRLQ